MLGSGKPKLLSGSIMNHDSSQSFGISVTDKMKC
jgi:hypothetical protein